MKSRVKCPACQSDSVIQNESGRKGTKTFYCLTCETSFAAQSVLRPPKIVAGIVVAALVIVPFVLRNCFSISDSHQVLSLGQR
jgi:hypothetical protein